MFTSNFTNKDEISIQTAKMLLEINAVNFNIENNYKLASGILSPCYIDCRKIISFPRVRYTLMNFLTSIIIENVGYENIDVIVGGETAGIPFAALISERLHIPMTYVRKKPKNYGKKERIEGTFKPLDNCLLVEDLTSDGGSKVDFVKAIRESGAECNHTAVVFFYNIFKETKRKLEKNKIMLHYLTDWEEIITQCKKNNYTDNKTLNEVEKFLDNPTSWSIDNNINIKR